MRKKRKSTGIEQKMRALTLNQLKALDHILESPQAVVESGTVGAAMGTASESLGGLISSLTRSKIDGTPVARVVAKSSDRRSYVKYNEELAPKNEMKSAVKSVLKDFGKFTG